MSHRIYTPEFKDEAVRQVVERGFTVPNMTEPIVADATFTLGEFEDGCFPFHLVADDGTEWNGSICENEFSMETEGVYAVLHKRR